jgi:hypothetical protein
MIDKQSAAAKLSPSPCNCFWGDTTIESIVRHLDIEIDDALAIAEQVEV